MIHEYALEPELVASWHKPIDYGYFIEQFGFNRSGDATGRVVAQYPKNWARRVWAALSVESGTSTMSRKRIEELLIKLQETFIRRPPHSAWDAGKTWLENAENEDIDRPFHAILASTNPRHHPKVMLGGAVSSAVSSVPPVTLPPLWRHPTMITVRRLAMAMANHLEPMLRCATTIFFIDPYFRASESRYRNPLREFLRIICDGSRPVTLEYHASASYTAAPTWGFFQHECERWLPRVIPHGFTLTVRRWKNRWRPGSERLHNRYILTDIGGVTFNHGLDEGDGTDDISRLSREIYRKRCNDYGHSGFNPAFDLEGEVKITGTSI